MANNELLTESRIANAELKRLNTSSQASVAEGRITNSELRKLNASSQAIASATAALATLQAQQVEESQKQTAIMEAQLQVAKIAELERNRQNQIKQAAFSVEEKLNEIDQLDSNVKKYFFYRDQENQVEYVNLTSDTPNEINDKKYVKEILDKLNSRISEIKKTLSDKERSDVDTYYRYINEMYDAKDLAESLAEKIRNTKLPKKLNIVWAIIMQTIVPQFLENKKINTALTIAYYILVPATSGLIFLAGAGSYFIFKGIEEKKHQALLSDYNNSIKNLENANNEVLRLEKFLSEFTQTYQLP